MTRHLLYIAFWYPPSRASGVYRALATTQAFTSRGWRVTVITTTRQFLEDEIGSTDESLERLVPEGVTVIRVPFSFGASASRRDVRTLGWWRGNFPTMFDRALVALAPIRRAVDIIRGRAPESYAFRDNYTSWIEGVVQTGRKVASQGIDHVLATGNPYSAFEAARIIAGITGLPFSVDYRDPWTIDVFTGKPVGDQATTATERQILEQATAAIHVNQAIATAYAEKYPSSNGKHHVVPNGFDRASVPMYDDFPRTGPLTFGILGTVNDSWPLEPIFEAWPGIRNELPTGSRLILGGHLGYFARSRPLLEATLPDSALGFEYVGPISKLDVAEFYQKLDVIVVPVPGGPMVTSGKVFEAMALGIPVVCVQARGGGAREVLASHPIAFCAAPNVNEVTEAMRRAAEVARVLTPDRISKMRESSARLERSIVMDDLVDVIDSPDQESQPA